ncbi:MAG: VCBS repeat-containing protein, partial [Syntrophobacterales bacterium]
SRIGGKHNVQVLDRKHVAKTFKKFKKDLNETTARSLAEDLGADYIVSGSVTFFGTGGSIDFKVYRGVMTQPPVAVYSLIEDMNNLLPQFSQVVDEMNAKAFDARPRHLAAEPRPQAQQVQTAPAPVPTETTPTGSKMASIKQQLIQEKPVVSDTSQPARSATLVAPQPPPWKSQKLKHALVSVAVGDLLGDQANQLAAISNKDLLVYRYSEGKLRQLAEIPAGKKDRFIWVSVADINQNGRDEIFVTNQKKLSGTQIRHSSFVLEWDGSRFATLARDVDYYLRAVRIPGEPVRLLGQKSADDGTLLPEIYNLVWKNSNLLAESRLSAPESADIFNSAMGDIISQGQTETIMITDKGYLFLMDINGHSIWKSYDHFGSTENYLELPLAAKDIPQPMDDIKGDGYRFAPTEIDDPNVKRRHLASPILLRDLNRDGKLEIIITHNLPTLAQLGGSSHYSKGEILSLSWGNYGMLENWKTDEIEGVITSLQIGDINGDGMEELIISTIQSGGLSSLWRANKSVIQSYPLRPR